ncbi:MAG: DUF481 domain-containing protein [Planctomycetes bacterium]|nr:DUF481 domain-containing protein [Planctomycetota bacterium]
MRLTTTVIVAALLGIAADLNADEIVFNNGDRITGKIEQLVDGKLTIDAEAAGKLTVDIANVRTFSTDEPVIICLKDGTILNQRALQDNDNLFAIGEGGVIRAQSFSADDLAAINPPVKPPAKWTGSLSVGVIATRGNTKTLNANITGNAALRRDTDRITLGVSYFYGEHEDTATGNKTVTKDSWFATGKYDYFVARKLYTFVNGRYERDRIADLERRIILGGGLGYQWIERDDRNFSTEAGLSWLYEEFPPPRNSTEQVSAQAGYHFDAKLNPKVKLIHELNIYPNFQNTSDYFLTTHAELRSSLTKSMYASFKVVLDYDATPAAGKEKEDLKYILGVGVNF